jgi:hypothetical protein
MFGKNIFNIHQTTRRHNTGDIEPKISVWILRLKVKNQGCCCWFFCFCFCFVLFPPDKTAGYIKLRNSFCLPSRACQQWPNTATYGRHNFPTMRCEPRVPFTMPAICRVMGRSEMFPVNLSRPKLFYFLLFSSFYFTIFSSSYPLLHNLFSLHHLTLFSLILPSPFPHRSHFASFYHCLPF